MIRIGIVGCGWFGNRHLDYLLTRNDVQVTALANPGQEKLMKTAEKVPGVKTFASGAELIASGLADAVIITVPPHAHEQFEELAAEKGIHLYIEKPLGVDADTVLRKLEAIEKSGIVCDVGYQERCDLGVARLREMIKPDEISLMEGAWLDTMPGPAWWRDKARSGGQLVEQTTHIADMMRLLAGEAAEVSGFAGRYPSEDYNVDDRSAAVIRFESGAVAVLTSGCFTQTPSGRAVGLRLFGKDFSADLRWGKSLQVNGREEWLFESDGQNHNRSLDTFLNAVKQKDPTLVPSTYRDSAKTFLLTLAIEKAFATGETVQLNDGFRI